MMGIPLGHAWRLMSEQSLDFVEVHSCLDESRRKGMPQIMKVEILDLGSFESAIEGSPEVAAVQRGVCFAAEHKSITRRPATVRLLIPLCEDLKNSLVDRDRPPFAVL
jgi:hypothetical protein